MGHASEGDLKGLFDDIDVNGRKLGETVPKRNEKLLALMDCIASIDFGIPSILLSDWFSNALNPRKWIAPLSPASAVASALDLPFSRAVSYACTAALLPNI